MVSRTTSEHITLAAVVLTAFVLFSPCRAATVRVPLDQPTIGEGIDAATLGDTVLVAPGVYTGSLNRDLAAPGLAVVSESGSELTVIDCENEGRAFSFGSHWSAHAEIAGFTIGNASPPFGEPPYIGGGMYLGGPVTVRSCVFEDCYGGTYGGGIDCYENASIIDCEFYRCISVYGGGLSIGGWSRVENCLFVDNRAYQKGGGIRAAGLTPVGGETVIEGCTLVGNTAADGGGIYCWREVANISHSVIAFNAGGGAVFCSDPEGDYVFSENIVFGNEDGDSLCGDYYQNMFADPLFCDLEWESGGRRDLTVCSNSPCLPANNDWGVQVGAFGEGCGECDSPVEGSTWGRLKALYWE